MTVIKALLLTIVVVAGFLAVSALIALAWPIMIILTIFMIIYAILKSPRI